ncbi:hypothetical protein [Streptomyces sp. SID12501]|uniref:DUF7134 domain-containing protein n=1 Tax=Streptomyces sp. SID12501 TaxID=2706042 RepID=UPI001EF1CA6B|nr:hypothetical protein [Streptomyces sp. SID12501]
MPPPTWPSSALTRLRTANPYAVNAALAILVLFAASLQWMFPDEGDDRLTWQGWLLAAATALPLVWRRRAPFACAMAVSVATPVMVIHHATPPDVMYGGLVIIYTMSAQGRPWQSRFMLLGWLAGVSVTIQHKEGAEPFAYAFQLLSLFFAYGLGVLARGPARLHRVRWRTAPAVWSGRGPPTPLAPWPRNGPGPPATCTTSSPTR